MSEKEDLIKKMNGSIEWIKKYVEKARANGVVIGSSGGKDSATVIAMATKALGKENVVTVSMPCNSIKEDLEDARLVAKTFEVPLLEIDLSMVYNEFENTVNSSLKTINKEIIQEAKINSKPRLRMTTLYSVAQSLGYLVMGTGNLCESTVGYTTKWGDNASDFNPIGNFTVSEVLAIGEHLGVPEKIIKKAPNDGLGGKTDEEKMGVTYKQIEEFIKTGKVSDKNEIKKIKKLNEASEHKRKLVPTYNFKEE